MCLQKEAVPALANGGDDALLLFNTQVCISTPSGGRTVQAMQIISYTDARNSLKAVIDKVIDDQAPTLIHRREGGNAVLMSEEAYASMQETFYLMSNPANARALLRSIEQAKAGKAKKRRLLDV